jgi:hypothetical protein
VTQVILDSFPTATSKAVESAEDGRLPIHIALKRRPSLPSVAMLFMLLERDRKTSSVPEPKSGLLPVHLALIQLEYATQIKAESNFFIEMERFVTRLLDIYPNAAKSETRELTLLHFILLLRRHNTDESAASLPIPMSVALLQKIIQLNPDAIKASAPRSAMTFIHYLNSDPDDIDISATSMNSKQSNLTSTLPTSAAEREELLPPLIALIPERDNSHAHVQQSADWLTPLLLATENSLSNENWNIIVDELKNAAVSLLGKRLKDSLRKGLQYVIPSASSAALSQGLPKLFKSCTISDPLPNKTME